MSSALTLTIFHLLCDTPWYLIACIPIYEYLRIRKSTLYLFVVGAALFRAVTTYLPYVLFSGWESDNVIVDTIYYLILVVLFLYAFKLEISELLYIFLLTYFMATFINYIAGFLLTPFYPDLDRGTTLVYTGVAVLGIAVSFPFLYRFFKGTVKATFYEVSGKEFKMLCIMPGLFLILTESYIIFSGTYNIPRFSSITAIILITGLVSCVIHLRMILESARHTRELQEANAVLEQKVEERTHELQVQAQIAENANKAKSAFLAFMSHEIRTPLNAIIGLSQIQLQNKLPQNLENDLRKIYSAGTGLLSIINEMLDISKIESGSFELVPAEYDLSSLISDSVQLNIVRIGSKPVEFQMEVSEELPVDLYGDALRIRQILNNLLSNAIKYTQKGIVKLSISGEVSGEDNWIAFSVSDTGIGIRPEDQEKVFSEYSQVDIKANRKIEGTGLGLSITRNLVQMMNGIITLESEYGRGSVFTVKIPQEVKSEKRMGRETVERLKNFQYSNDEFGNITDLRRVHMPYGKVLVVDDVLTNLDVAKGLILPYGITVDCVQSGHEAIERVRAAEVIYDAVFMDHMMPDMDGIEATRRIRRINSEYAVKIPIIALTANALSGNAEMFMSRGFTDFLAKPIDITALDGMLNKYVRNQQIEAEYIEKVIPEEHGEMSRYLEGLAIPECIRRYGGEQGYLEVLHSYQIHTPDLLEKLEGFLAAGNLTDYGVVVHGLKGSSYGIGAGDIGKLAESLEMAAKAGDYDAVSKENGRLLKAVKQLLEKLAVLNKAEEIKKEKRKEPERQLLERMIKAGEEFMITEMGEILAELEKYEYETDQELIHWLRKQVNNLEYDEIVKKIRKLLR